MSTKKVRIPRRFKVMVHRGKGPSEMSYGAEVTNLAGCFSSGDTIAELKRNLCEAIELYLDNGESVSEDRLDILNQGELAGGKREGAGRRPLSDEPTRPFSIRIPESVERTIVERSLRDKVRAAIIRTVQRELAKS